MKKTLLPKRTFFDERASEWDAIMITEEAIRDAHELMQKLDIPRGARIIDIGCGTGILTRKLRSLTGREGAVFSCDFSLEMLTVAREKHDFPYVCADAHHLPFTRESFDYAICFSCYPHFDDKKAVLEEINRILRRQGTLVIAHICHSKKLSRIHRRAGGAVKHDKLPSEQVMRKQVKNAGYSLLELNDNEEFYLLRARKL